MHIDYKDIKTGQTIGRRNPPPMAIPYFYKELSPFPAHSEIIIDGTSSDEYIKEGFYDAKLDQFLYTFSVNTEVYYQGSDEPIGYYKNGKFDAKTFNLNSQIIITKKKGLRLGHVLKPKKRPVIVY